MYAILRSCGEALEESILLGIWLIDHCVGIGGKTEFEVGCEHNFRRVATLVCMLEHYCCLSHLHTVGRGTYCGKDIIQLTNLVGEGII